MYLIKSNRCLSLLLLLVVLWSAGCDSDKSRPRNPAPLSFTVDASIKPPVESLPPLAGSEPRPLGSINSGGVQADFVVNELWLATDDENQLDAFLERWNGKVIASFYPEEFNLGGMKHQYLVQVDVSAADTRGFIEDLLALDPNSEGEQRVSSEQGLKLLTAGVKESRAGLTVGVNWVANAAGFADRNLVDAPSGANIGAAYEPNAFTWTTHSTGSIQDIGVAEAWRALDFAGKLDNKVKIAILDMGFEPDQDMPSGWQAFSNVPFVDPIGTENLLDCGASPCPWHGTNVASAAMAVPNNAYGSAGPAGPVGDAILVFTSYDFFTSMAALGEANILGARVVNMSYSAPVPYYLAWSVLPFDLATYIYAENGLLLFAAAGNNGANVDATTCFITCWEKTWHTPCENSGVICVGGLDVDSKNRDRDSNYGHEDVDIFAPFNLLLGPDPNSPGNRVRKKSGTSFSAPFAAGVAALIKAANPNLSAGGVKDILYQTAHGSPDDTVNRYVNALGAVTRALGNVAPKVEIARPANWGEYPLNNVVSFDSLVEDFEDGLSCCTYKWTSNVDGLLATTKNFSHQFATTGSRAIKLEVTDSGSARASAMVNIVIRNYAPVPKIDKPSHGEIVTRDVKYLMRGSAFDLNEGGDLDCGSLSWTSSVAADPFPLSGCEVNVTFTSNGARTLILTAVDPQGESATASVNVTVDDPPPNLPPEVQILSPASGINVGTSTLLSLESTAKDPEGKTQLSHEWVAIFPYDNATGTGSNSVTIGTSQNLNWRPDDSIDFGSGEVIMFIRLQLNAKDPEGNIGSDFVVIKVTRFL